MEANMAASYVVDGAKISCTIANYWKGGNSNG
jgi:hypothetical protein